MTVFQEAHTQRKMRIICSADCRRATKVEIQNYYWNCFKYKCPFNNFKFFCLQNKDSFTLNFWYEHIRNGFQRINEYNNKVNDWFHIFEPETKWVSIGQFLISKYIIWMFCLFSVYSPFLLSCQWGWPAMILGCKLGCHGLPLEIPKYSSTKLWRNLQHVQ